MVNPEQVVNLKAFMDPVNPPAKTCLFMLVPVIEGVSPELTICRKLICGHACHKGRLALTIELEQLRLGPNFHTIG